MHKTRTTTHEPFWNKGGVVGSKNCGGSERSGRWVNSSWIELGRASSPIAKLVADPRLTQKRQILPESRIGGVYHNGEVARELLPLVVVALGNILRVCQLDWRQKASLVAIRVIVGPAE